MKGFKLQTPKSDHQQANRKSKSIYDHTKKPQKISKKCLDSVFSLVSDDVSLEFPKDSIEFASISEISDDHQLGESAESFIASPSPMLSPSAEPVASSNLTPLSSTITSDSHFKNSELKDSDDIVAVEAEMVVNHLKQAQIQVMNSASTDLRSKKLLDALINEVIEEFNVLPEEKDQFAEIVAMKTRVVLVSFLLWILVVSVIFLFRPRVQSSFPEPPPT
ncbi:uncharacterized protein LOC130764041 [Actinidia eriantha]|uniref:uncharacterized protein LOC130764041 n=1 Tax=Actinidia eriantha TaxID=165200 RepID=UPI0025897868|nr:uncharacterized protein LOC130764041 [Actinidia eriantha]